jgi:hypothetical protein
MFSKQYFERIKSPNPNENISKEKDDSTKCIFQGNTLKASKNPNPSENISEEKDEIIASTFFERKEIRRVSQ